MSKARVRGWLDTGLRLDINEMMRAGLNSGTYELEVTDPGLPTKGAFRVHMDDGPLRWIQILFPGFDQTIGLTKVPRHFGGFQWYFFCPMTGDRASVLWLPRGQNAFASQKYWKTRRKAYSSQFLSPHQRAEQGIERIEARLVYDATDELMYKPKRMRLATYQRVCERLDAYEKIVSDRLVRVAARLMGRL